MKENRNLEFITEITNTFLKTVSAFSNYDGTIIKKDKNQAKKEERFQLFFQI